MNATFCVCIQPLCVFFLNVNWYVYGSVFFSGRVCSVLPTQQTLLKISRRFKVSCVLSYISKNYHQHHWLFMMVLIIKMINVFVWLSVYACIRFACITIRSVLRLASTTWIWSIRDNLNANKNCLHWQFIAWHWVISYNILSLLFLIH